MCHKIRYDGKSWKVFEFRDELNKAHDEKKREREREEDLMFQQSFDLNIIV
jgi:hypothetical protein